MILLTGRRPRSHATASGSATAGAARSIPDASPAERAAARRPSPLSPLPSAAPAEWSAAPATGTRQLAEAAPMAAALLVAAAAPQRQHLAIEPPSRYMRRVGELEPRFDRSPFVEVLGARCRRIRFLHAKISFLPCKRMNARHTANPSRAADARFSSPWRGEVAARSAAGGGEQPRDPTETKRAPHPAPFGRDPPSPGEGEGTCAGKTHSFSRRDPRPSFAVQRVDSAERHRVTPEPAVGPASARSCSAHIAPDGASPLVGYETTNNKIRKTKRRQTRNLPSASRRQVYATCANCLACGRALIAARSPVRVPPRYLRPRTNAAAQLQNALPGTRHPPGVT